MMPTYMLPDGYAVDAIGEADCLDWNGYPVPILDAATYYKLAEHIDHFDLEGARYAAEYVNDGKVTSGYYCDGLQWRMVDEEEGDW